MPDIDPIVQALLGNRQYPTDDPIAGIQSPLQVPKIGQTVPPVNAAPNPQQVMSGVGDLTGVNDAIRALRGQMTPEEAQTFAMGAIPMALGGPEAKAAEELAPPLYSAAAKAIQDARLTKGTPEQWLGYLRNQPGVKQDELSYMGALPKTDTGQLSKEDMQSWANANQVQLKEVTKGGPNINEESIGNHTEQIMRRDHPNLRDGTDEYYAAYDDAMQRAEDEMRGGIGGGGTATKFNDPKLTLPGGQNYREMLLTLPQQMKPTGRFVVTDGSPSFNMAANTQTEAQDIVNNLQQHSNRPLQIIPENAPDSSGNFTSSHWDEPNVIAHARMNDRVVPDAEGNPQKTLFLEELQSDWHQAGRKRGYQAADPDQDASDYLKSQGYDTSQSQLTPLQMNQAARELGWNTGVPDAPFKTTWPDLVLKRMVRHAAENGYDQLGWTPGDVQADRYDLSKQVDAIHAFKNDNGTFDIAAMPKNAVQQSDAHQIAGQIPPEKLQDYVGKDLADKISGQTIREQKYDGGDLRVGGEGMRGFYDKMLVDKANAIGKKYGAKVTQAPLETNQGFPQKYQLIANNGDHIRDFTSPQEATTWAQQNGAANASVREAPAISPISKSVHVLPITPELKKAALTKGFPMFAAGGLAAGIAGRQPGSAPAQPQQPLPDPNAQMLSALRGSQPTLQQ